MDRHSEIRLVSFSSLSNPFGSYRWNILFCEARSYWKIMWYPAEKIMWHAACLQLWNIFTKITFYFHISRFENSEIFWRWCTKKYLNHQLHHRHSCKLLIGWTQNFRKQNYFLLQFFSKQNKEWLGNTIWYGPYDMVHMIWAIWYDTFCEVFRIIRESQFISRRKLHCNMIWVKVYLYWSLNVKRAPDMPRLF